ncbi:bestrophin family protein [Synechococcus elongatus]|uniref:Bestrophin family ion channel n=1 Tax=Synechococcus elongatus PCC 11801 TaxID=2219813 RepID=A0AAN1UVC7_SYNEL|nr:bestrophin family ion channel [Synechococcus elongatus]AZB73552.1 hypothetical protein DOP62_13295 [Synechococcus elongatus PCC 11801]
MAEIPQTEAYSWIRSSLRLRGSVVPIILPQVIYSSLFGVVVAWVHTNGFSLDLPALSSLIPNIVLGLLLVFRTNTAYERFWEGRRIWGTQINLTRNLARLMWVEIPHSDRAAEQQLRQATGWLVALSIVMKQWLRRQPLEAEELNDLVSPAEYQQLLRSPHPVLEVALWIDRYLQQQLQRGLAVYQLNEQKRLLNGLIDCLGGCERIRNTPMPLAYSVHLKQLMLIYCFTMPLQLVGSLGWRMPLVVGIISFALLGIEAIGHEIENPFGMDANDLRLEQFCNTLRSNLQPFLPDGTIERSPLQQLPNPAPTGTLLPAVIPPNRDRPS